MSEQNGAAELKIKNGTFRKSKLQNGLTKKISMKLKHLSFDLYQLEKIHFCEVETLNDFIDFGDYLILKMAQKNTIAEKPKLTKLPYLCKK